MTKRVYLNFAYGVRPKKRRAKPTAKSREIFAQLRRNFSVHMGCAPSELKFAQNVTTHIMQAVRGIKKQNPNYSIFVDSHEVPWVKTSIEAGELDSKNMTRPNFARRQEIKAPKSRVNVADPASFTPENIEKILGRKQSIVVLSHISRMTGATMPIRQIYEKMKQLNPNSVLIVDGAQATGAMKLGVKGSCDMYIGVTSKFFDAQPHLAVAYLSPELREKYLQQYPTIQHNEFVREAHSAVQKMSNRVFQSDFEKRIIETRQFALEKLGKIKGITIRQLREQAPQILTFSVGNRETTKRVVAELKKSGIEVFHNMDWSIVEPENPMIRVSIGATTARNEISQFTQRLTKVLRRQRLQ